MRTTCGFACSIQVHIELRCSIACYVIGIFLQLLQFSSRSNWLWIGVTNIEDDLQDNNDLYAEEAAVQREAERRRMLSIPGLVAPSELQDEMIDT